MSRFRRRVPAGTKHAGELGQNRLKAGHVDESERADDDIRAIIGQRQPVQLSDAKLAIGDTPPRMGEHVR